MLILTRKLNESITIGDDVKITVLEIEKGHVRLGIEAPRHISIHREEVYERIREENHKAAKANGQGAEKQSPDEKQDSDSQDKKEG
ncbi:MAG: carbon storage regulator CsrA [Candidatus Zhuqueibacterota bacterium]